MQLEVKKKSIGTVFASGIFNYFAKRHNHINIYRFLLGFLIALYASPGFFHSKSVNYIDSTYVYIFLLPEILCYSNSLHILHWLSHIHIRQIHREINPNRLVSFVFVYIYQHLKFSVIKVLFEFEVDHLLSKREFVHLWTKKIYFKLIRLQKVLLKVMSRTYSVGLNENSTTHK